MQEYKIYNDDCLNALKNIDDGSIDCIIVDLPYFNVVKDSWDNCWNNETEYLNWIEKNIIEYKRVLKNNSNIFLFTGRQYNRKIACILDKYFIEKRIIIWARKRLFNNTRGKALASGYEPICFYSKGKNPPFNNIKIKIDSKRKEYNSGILKNGISLSDVWCDIPSLPHNSKEKVDHSTQKPVKLIERIIMIGSNEGDLILDSCAGSGTTGVACMNTNRRCVLIEKEEKYCEIIKNRLQDKEREIKERLF